MKKRHELFQVRLYLEGLKRLRIIGIALAILCISISVLVPISHWMETEESVRTIVRPDTLDIIRSRFVTTVDHYTLSIPSLVMSYLAPLFVFFAFSYLHKRRESDFYHAVPYTRTCVYVSFMAAAMSWAWGILLASSLAGAAVWALSPYATLAPFALVGHLLTVVLNALLLCSVAALAVCLMGTPLTSLLAFGLLLVTWRFLLFVAMSILDDMCELVLVEKVLGGYLDPSFLLPVSILTDSISGKVLLYALLVSVVFLVLGGLCYVKRKSEIAGHSVAGKWKHIVLRGLLCLPFALVIVYQLIGDLGGDVSLTLVLLVLTVLTFYLYELLTTRSVKSMVRATPYLGAVLVFCVLFGSAVTLADTVVKRENISANEIRAVGFERSYGSGSTYGMSEYEMYMIAENMSKNEQVRAMVADAFSETQQASRWGLLYEDTSFYDYKYVYMRMRLAGGMTIVRKVRFEQGEYAAMLELIRKDTDIDPVPSAQHIASAELQMPSYDYSEKVDPKHYAAIVDTVCADWEMLSGQERTELFSEGWKAEEYPILLTLRLKLDKDYLYVSLCPTESMTRTRRLLEELLQEQIPSDAELLSFFDQCEQTAYNGEIRLAVPHGKKDDSTSYFHFYGEDVASLTEVLKAYLPYRLPANRLEDAYVLTLTMIDYESQKYAGEMITSSYSMVGIYDPMAVAFQKKACLILDLDDEAVAELRDKIEQIGKQ